MSIKHKLYNLCSSMVGFVLPLRCINCGTFVVDALCLCNDCWEKLHIICEPFCSRCGRPAEISLDFQYECVRCMHYPPSYDSARSLFKFEEHIQAMVHGFKYYDKTIYAKFFAKQIVARYSDIISKNDLILAVPMHKLKRIVRLYNQAQLLANELSKLTSIPIDIKVLHKTKLTPSQTTLTKKQRELNLKDTISCNNIDNIMGKNILLVDDVITTGSTVNYCSKILKNAGAKSVNVIAVAIR